MRCILIICFLLTINISNCIWIWSCLNDFIWNKMKVEWVNSDGLLCNDVKDQAKDEPISNMMSLFLQVCLFMSWNSQWQVERSFQNAMCFIIFWYYTFFKELSWLFLRILSHAQVRVTKMLSRRFPGLNWNSAVPSILMYNSLYMLHPQCCTF